MSKQIFSIYFFFLLTFIHTCLAQEKSKLNSSTIITEILEDYRSEDENLAETLSDLIENPLDLNNETEMLSVLPFLNEEQIEEIEKLKKEKGRIKSFTELEALPHFTKADVQKLKYFTQINLAAQPLKLNFTARVSESLKDGAFQDSYLGNPLHTYQKFNFQSEKVIFNALSEKDAGEKNYFDYTSFSVRVKNLINHCEFLIGDYQVEFGQGLSLWSPYAFGKSAGNSLAIIRHPRGARLNTFTAENKFFRGSVLKANYKRFGITLFASQRNLSATVDSAENIVPSFYDLGYFRTQKELSKKGTVQNKTLGTIVNLGFGEFSHVGLLFLNSNFDKEIQRKEDSKPFRNYSILSSDYSLRTKSFSLNGEISWDFNSLAFLNFLEIPFSRKLRIITSVRNYPSHFVALYGHGFGERGKTQNEIGFYNGLSYFYKYFKLNFYYDIFSFPSSSNLSNFPVTGNELSLEIKTRPLGKIIYTLRGFVEKKKAVTDNLLVTVTKNRFRFQIDYGDSKKIKLKTRLEISAVRETDLEKGFLFLQDFNFRQIKNFLLCFRIIYFKTSSYESRIYEYENDLFGVMTNQALFGEGVRSYVLLKLSILKLAVLEFKYAFQHYRPPESRTFTNRSKISFQLRLSY